MELKHIKELMAIMGRTGTKRLEFKSNGVELILDRGEQKESNFVYESKDMPPYHFFPHPWSNPSSNAQNALEKTNSRAAASIAESNLEDLTSSTYVTSLMIGTFYAGPGPGQPPFIKVGDKVEKDVTIVAIIDAMKVMNEIKANASGTVVEILVESGQPVEFGTKLFRLVE